MSIQAEWQGSMRCVKSPGGGGGTPLKGLNGDLRVIEFIIFCLNQGIDSSIFVLNRINVLNGVSKIGILS